MADGSLREDPENASADNVGNPDILIGQCFPGGQVRPSKGQVPPSAAIVLPSAASEYSIPIFNILADTKRSSVLPSSSSLKIYDAKLPGVLVIGEPAEMGLEPLAAQALGKLMAVILRITPRGVRTWCSFDLLVLSVGRDSTVLGKMLRST